MRGKALAHTGFHRVIDADLEAWQAVEHDIMKWAKERRAEIVASARGRGCSISACNVLAIAIFGEGLEMYAFAAFSPDGVPSHGWVRHPAEHAFPASIRPLIARFGDPVDWDQLPNPWQLSHSQRAVPRQRDSGLLLP